MPARRGVVEQAVEKPCLKLAGQTGSFYGGVATILACGVLAVAADSPAQPSRAPDCPPLFENALVPAPPAGGDLAFHVAAGTVTPSDLQSVSAPMFAHYPAGCWLRIGVKPAVFSRALSKTLAAASVTAQADPGASLVLDATILAERHGDIVHAPGNSTRSAYLSVRYRLTKPVSGREIWAEVITTDESVNYGPQATGAPKEPLAGAGAPYISRLAFERAIHSNLATLSERLHTIRSE